ncbi:uncharacterized protein [Pyxicephalus adspersus]|uniref:uncharacterized protein n=1 Tax=Pyxicephalus adspersus TaxID=30357 RepID=UPI003B5CB104
MKAAGREKRLTMILLRLWILLSAAGMSNAIYCLYKRASLGTTEVNITCPSNYNCSCTLQEVFSDITKEDGNSSIEYNCVQQEFCDFLGSFTAGQQRMRISVTCCDTDFCIPEMPKEMNISNPEPNGVTCPICSDNNTSCDTGETMKCKGEESRCAIEDQIGDTLRTRRGCATNNFCNFFPDLYYCSPTDKLSYMCDPTNNTPASFNTVTVLTIVIIHLLFYIFVA